MKKVFFVFAFSGFGSLLAFARQPVEDTLQRQLPEVVITPTLLELPAAEAPRSVSTVAAEEVRRLQPLDLAQQLSYLPGINVTGSALNPGSNESVFIRGTNSNHSVVLLDGLRLSDPVTPGGALDFSELPISSFGALEVLRGAQSLGFGNGALGGVIYLTDPGWQKTGPHVGLAVSAGTFGKGTVLLQQQADVGYSWNNGLYARLGISNKHVNGMDATLDTVTRNVFKSYDRDDFAQLRGSLRIGFERGHWKAHVFGAVTEQHTDFDKRAFKFNNPFGENPDAWYDGDRSEIDFNRNLLGYQLQGRLLADLDFRITGGFSGLNRSVLDDSSVVRLPDITDHTFSASDYQGNTTNHDAHFIFTASEAFQLIAGLGYLREQMKFNSTYFTNSFWGPYTFEVTLDTLEPASVVHGFLQAQLKGNLLHKALEPLTVLAGMRYSRHSQFGGRNDFVINPSWKFGNQALLFASASTGYQAPSLYQLYSPDKYYMSDVTRGNPDLQPEEALSLEAGMRFFFSRFGYLEAALFRNHINHAIEYCYLWDQNIPIDSLGTDWYRDDFRGDTYLNAGELTSEGIEVTLRLQPLQWLEVLANASLLEGTLHYGPDLLDATHASGHTIQLFYGGAFPQKETSEAPLVRRGTTANAQLIVSPLNSLKVFVMGRHIGQRNDIFYDGTIPPFGAQNVRSLNAYTLFDAGVYYTPLKVLSLSMKVENMFNTEVTEIYGYTGRPRGYFLSAYLLW